MKIFGWTFAYIKEINNVNDLDYCSYRIEIDYGFLNKFLFIHLNTNYGKVRRQFYIQGENDE